MNKYNIEQTLLDEIKDILEESCALADAVDLMHPLLGVEHLEDDYAATVNLASDTTALQLPSAHEAVTCTGYAHLACSTKTRPPSLGGYTFPKSNHESQRLLPSPCKVCGGEKHWDRECPHWVQYEQRCKQGILYASAEQPPDDKEMYQSVYSVHVNELAAYCVSSSTLQSSLPQATVLLLDVQKKP